MIEQDPGPGSQVDKLSAVNLVVSRGIETAEVPDVTGKSDTEAAQILQDAGFVLTLPTQEFSSKAAGTVLAQDPKAGASVAKGASVTLTVSKGQELVEVPDVVGDGQSAARKALEAMGFDVRGVEEFSDTVDKGYVISQNPSSGLPAYKGTTVTITVSKGENLVTVPDVVDMTQAEAEAALEKAGLVVSNVEFQDAPAEQDGVVLSQTPTANTKVAPGTGVNLIVGRLAPVPPGP